MNLRVLYQNFITYSCVRYKRDVNDDDDDIDALFSKKRNRHNRRRRSSREMRVLLCISRRGDEHERGYESREERLVVLFGVVCVPRGISSSSSTTERIRNNNESNVF